MGNSTSGVRGRLVVALVSLVAFSNTAAAAQGTGASIIGQVTDESGAVLPGVTVTASSPACADNHGRHHVVGEHAWRRCRWRLRPTFELAGFRPAQRQTCG